MGYSDYLHMPVKPNKIVRGIIITVIIAVVIILIIAIVINTVKIAGDKLYLIALVAIPVSILYILKNPTKTKLGYGEVSGSGIMDWMFGEPELTPAQKTQRLIDANNGQMTHGYHG